MGIKTKLAQFVCPYCGKGFEQKSKIQRHIQTSHPPAAPSAAIVLRGTGQKPETPFVQKIIN
jgi:hypothetical protein